MRNFDIDGLGGGAGLGGVVAKPGALPAVLSERIAVTGFTMDFAPNEEIFGEQEPADFVYRLVSGAVRTVRILADGRRQIEAFVFPGDVFGLEDRPVHSIAAEAVCGSRVILVRRNAIERSAERDVAAARELWSFAATDVRRMREHMLLLGRKGAVERVAAFLLEIADRTQSPRHVELAMSRSDIADYLGLTIESVSRSVTQLEREGRIVLNGARRIAVPDPQALADCAGVIACGLSHQGA